MKNLVIYHRDCPDGLIAYLCAEQGLGAENCEGFPAHYGEAPPVDRATGKAVYVLDFSYPPEQLKALAKVARKVVVLDHHLTAYKQLCADPAALITEAQEGQKTCFAFADAENLLARINFNQSGATMSYDYFCKGWSHLLDFARYAEDRDLWRFELMHSQAVNAFLSALPYDDMSVWKDEISKGWERMVEPGYAILRWKEKAIASTAKLAVRVPTRNEQGTLVAMVCNVLPSIRSEVAGLIAKDGDFGVGWWFDGSRGVYMYALRSSGTVDVEEFARMRGGGGHKHAAAFESKFPVHECGFERNSMMWRAFPRSSKEGLELERRISSGEVLVIQPRTDVSVFEASGPATIV